MPLEFFPPLNASLNAINTVLLLCGFVAIKSGRVTLHRAIMLSAVTVSAIFLGCYLYYHFHHGVTKFTTPGWPRTVYFSILISHTLLAVTVLPLVAAALTFAFRAQFETHKKITRWLWPIWLYVSVTGVLVY